MPAAVPVAPPSAGRAVILIAALVVILASVAPVASTAVNAADGSHLLVSEVVTGGASASDELIEVYNPTAGALPLEGLELIYVSASGATISRRAAWSLGAPSVPPGGHVLVANEAGLFAPIADAVYASGMAAAGGSVAIRILGASSAIDAVGWGTAVSTWREGTNALVAAAGASIERLPGGAVGSTQDTDDNAADFVERPVPEPQNLASPPTPDPGDPSPTPTATATATPSPEPTPSPAPTTSPTPAATPSPSPAPSPGAIPVAAARDAADGSEVIIEATALTASDFHDGGGFVADDSGGIAVLVTDGAFSRGARLRISGTVDDRFSQRTIRADGAEIADLGSGEAPPIATVATGDVDEALEGRLVKVTGTIVGPASPLTTGTAFDLDDGSGAARIVVASATGIDLAGWVDGATIELVGVAGQRDSSGTGVEGYRVLPRDAADIIAVGTPTTSPTPTPTPSGSASPSATPTASPLPEDLVSIADARAAAKNARLRVRGVVTLGSGVVDPQTAVIQDGSGAIVLRLADEAGTLSAGELVEVGGTRSTKSGMETLRVNEPPLQLDAATLPAARSLRTGEAGEAHEALLVEVRGALVASARRSGSGTVSFEVDDGSGPLRVVLGAALEADADELSAGSWVEVRGVLGQETTGAQPLRGYRVWPASADDMRLVAGTTLRAGGGADVAHDVAGRSPAARGLQAVGGPAAAGERVAATLVVGPWPELGIGGLLWDGQRLVAVAAESAGVVEAALGRASPPIALELAPPRVTGTETVSGAPLVALAAEPGALVPSAAAPAPPRTDLGGEAPAWVSIVGSFEAGGALRLADGGRLPVERRCANDGEPTTGDVALLAVAVAEPARLVVPCGGIRPVAVLERGAASGSPARIGAGRAAAAAITGVPPEADPRRPLAAGILLVAAVGLGLLAAWRRHAPSAPEEGATVEDPASDALAPRLTLVTVPRDHGP